MCDSDLKLSDGSFTFVVRYSPLYEHCIFLKSHSESGGIVFIFVFVDFGSTTVLTSVESRAPDRLLSSVAVAICSFITTEYRLQSFHYRHRRRHCLRSRIQKQ
jgi:hypothetical protein